MTDEEMLAGVTASLAAAQAGQGNFKVSKDEADKMTAAFEKKEFRDMFMSYLHEMADPKARAVRENARPFRWRYARAAHATPHALPAPSARRSKRHTCNNWSERAACPRTCCW